MSMMRDWNPTGDDAIGKGITLLEASAGTGKTWSIASILLRLIAERGVPMRQVLVVTYTRAATAELKDRIRKRIADAVAFLEGRGNVADGDDVLEHLRTGASGPDGAQWLRRLRSAQESLDECLISTIHGFCERMLAQYAFESQADFDLELFDDITEIRLEMVDDWVSRAYHGADPARRAFLEGGGFTREALDTLANVALEDPDAPVLPTLDEVPADGRTTSAKDHGDAWAVAQEKARFVAWVRAEYDRRMAARRAQSFQDLVRKLAKVLRDPANPARVKLKKAIGERFRVALVDEFQDTDAHQWDILRELFADDGHWLFLIGDPKQAIYGFRGANIHVYLHAKLAAQPRCYTMRRNFRSDARLVAALNHLMDRPGFFAEENIDYVAVDTPPPKDAPAERIRFSGLGANDFFTAPLQIRFADTDMDQANADGAGKPLPQNRYHALMATCAAEDIARLLAAGARLYDPRSPLADADGFRPVHPGDIAVLTRRTKQGSAMQEELAKLGVPSVLMGEDSVLASEEARELQAWLQALANPGRDDLARTAATTRLFGRDGTLLARVDAQDAEALRQWEQWLTRLASWRKLYAGHGFLRTLRTALQQDTLPAAEADLPPEDVTVRTLRRLDGERRLTNVWHLAELLHEAESAGRLQLTGLLSWLKRQRVNPTVDAQTRQLRLERDDHAVSVMTLHKAKGLEFPIVYLPFLTDSIGPSDKQPTLSPRPDRPVERVLDLRPPDDCADTWQRIEREHAKEQLRLLYVALTRARVRCVLYSGFVKDLDATPLAPALHADQAAPPADRLQSAIQRVAAASSKDLWDDLVALAEHAPQPPPLIGVSRCEPPGAMKPVVVQPSEPRIAARPFLRFGIDHIWRRHSYSSIAHGHAVSYADPEGQEGVDRDGEDGSVAETARSAWVPVIAVPEGAESVPLADFPANTRAGTFFHACFEHMDFTWALPGEADGPAQLRELLARLLSLHGFETDKRRDTLETHLPEVLRTPLGAVLGDTRLCDIPRSARLNELRFDLPIAGGSHYDRRRGDRPVAADGIVHALKLGRQAHPSPDEERTIRRAYLDGLDHFAPLAGFLTGSIDMVFRHEVDGHPRWFVVDYKSNRLDPQRTGKWPIQHFCLEGMRFEMERHHYYLQYHLYVLALHRYLRFRMRDRYDYDRDMGGVYYLFFRGMIGEQTPVEDGRRFGCFYDKPPRQVIEALDGVFAAQGRAEGACA